MFKNKPMPRMVNNMDPQVIKAIEWIQDQARRIEYGNVTLTIIRHGKTWRVEKTVTEKVLVED